MQANRARDTSPELAVRRLLHASGLRYRVHIRPLVPGRTGRADIVFTRVKIAVFIDGCFWHGCPDHGRSSFQRNPEYWSSKIAGNQMRDQSTTRLLQSAGWTVLRFWEHETPEDIADEIRSTVAGKSL